MIDNEVANSEIRILAKAGNITISDADIRAKKLLHIDCDPAGCQINVTDSVLIASEIKTAVFPPVAPYVGDLFILAEGDINLQNSTVFGENKFIITSHLGRITMFCPTGVTGVCRDPLLSSTAAALCDTILPSGLGPEDFPCNVTFNTPDDIKAVCIKEAPGVICGGGGTEGRIQAFKEIDLHGSTIRTVSHLTIHSQGGCTAPSTVPLPGPPPVCINLQDTHLDAEIIIVRADTSDGTNTGVIDLCATAAGATVVDDVGADFPTFNGDLTPPFTKVVAPGYETILDDAVDCPAPLFPASIS